MLRVMLKTDFYDLEQVPEHILKQRPLVMDPVNPWNNVAARLLDCTTISLLANESLVLLGKDTPSIQDLLELRLGNDMTRLFEQFNFKLKHLSIKSSKLVCCDH